MTMRAPLSVRFWAKVNKTGPVVRPELGPCWEWTAAKNPAGYGLVGLGSRTEGLGKAHRVSWELTNGPIGNGLFVLHRCDNRACVNPGHLFLGTNLDNVRDMRAKGRGFGPPHHRGEANHRARLTAERVQALRAHIASGQSIAESARLCSINYYTAWGIARGHSWRHVA